MKFGDGQVLGVGIPIIAFLSRPISDARAFAAATKVTVNGRPVVLGLEAAAHVLVRPKESMPLRQFPVLWQDSRVLVDATAPK